MNKSQTKKSKFRGSKEWKAFRLRKRKEQNNIDPITGSKLPKGAHLHHKDLNEDEYENIDNPDNFILLLPTTHKWIHWGLTQIKKTGDLSVINKYVKELKREAKLNGFIGD